MLREYEQTEAPYVMRMQAHAYNLNVRDFSLRWQYIYRAEIDAIICQDTITGAWYRVPETKG